MIRRWLSISLTVLIALQSVGAVMEETQPRQLDQKHISVDHINEASELKTVEKLDPGTSSYAQFDCDHCCHCHGNAQLSDLIDKGYNHSLLDNKSFEYDFKDSSIFLLPKLRPPIA